MQFGINDVAPWPTPDGDSWAFLSDRERAPHVTFRARPFGSALVGLLVRGLAPSGGRFHLQITAAANQASQSDELLFRIIPDLDNQKAILANQSADWVAITLRAVLAAQMISTERERGARRVAPAFRLTGRLDIGER